MSTPDKKQTTLCAETVKTPHGFRYWIEPSGEEISVDDAVEMRKSAKRIGEGLFPCCPGQQWLIE